MKIDRDFSGGIRVVGLLLVSLGMCALSGCRVVEPAPAPSAMYMLSDAQSRAISPENLSGDKGGGSRVELADGTSGDHAKELGKGWKVNPFIRINAGQKLVLGQDDGPGVIQHIWMTVGGNVEYRSLILRMYWDDEEHPSVEAPVGDFFASPWGSGGSPIINSAVVAMNPGAALNCFWQMPFRKKFRIEMENRSTGNAILYYQIDYAKTEVPTKAGYFHAQFRQLDRMKSKEVFTILDGVRGRGHYVGTSLAHGAFSPGWWGEGEVKFYIDGDTEYPTINGTGEEDYFLGSWNYYRHDESGKRIEMNFSSLYSGFNTVNKTDVTTQYDIPNRERRIGEYRWHIPDPIHFKNDLKVTLQGLGWKKNLYLPLEDYYASVAFWYQQEPHATFPVLPDEATLKIRPLQLK
jgi:hypothetical protein